MARANKEYKNLNCKIDKGISDKLEKFIEYIKASNCYCWENIDRIYREIQ